MSIETSGQFQHVPTRDGLNLEAFWEIQRIDDSIIAADERARSFVEDLPEDTAQIREEVHQATRRLTAGAEQRIPTRREKFFFRLGIGGVVLAAVAEEFVGHANYGDAIGVAAAMTGFLGYSQARWDMFEQRSGH
jgi:hypothetical protein